jgi:hypothetical protein
MVNWDNVKPVDFEYALRAFNHGVKEEYEELFRHPFYKKKSNIRASFDISWLEKPIEDIFLQSQLLVVASLEYSAFRRA